MNDVEALMVSMSPCKSSHVSRTVGISNYNENTNTHVNAHAGDK